MNIESLLSITPSKEGKIKIIVKAVEDGLTENPEHIDTARQFYESNKDYLSAARMSEKLGDKELAEIYRSM